MNMTEYMDQKSNYKEHKDNHVKNRIIQKVQSDLEKILKGFLKYFEISLFCNLKKDSVFESAKTTQTEERSGIKAYAIKLFNFCIKNDHIIKNLFRKVQNKNDWNFSDIRLFQK